MLKQLAIENFTIIEKISIDYDLNMTAITGETGAGKSVVIDALELVLGGRAESKMIRHGCERADIVASFDVEVGSAADQWLVEQMLNEAEGCCILRRSIQRSGRSSAYINGKACPVSQLKALGQMLVNIHGQHEHHALLNAANQRQRLDYYAQLTPLCQKMQQAFQAWQQAQKTYQTCEAEHAAQQAKQALLQYQIEELEQLALQEGELEQLLQQHKRLDSVQQLQGLCQQSLAALVDADDSNVMQVLHHCQQAFTSQQDNDAALQNVSQLLDEAAIAVTEACGEIKAFSGTLVEDPEQQQHIEARLEAIHALARKHQVAVEHLWLHQTSLREQMANLQQLESQLAEAKTAEQTCLMQAKKLAKQLSNKRQKAAKTLAAKIEKMLRQLGMEGGRCHIAVTADDEMIHAYGIDNIQCEVSTNPGQPLQPLAAVVSGGELSRISLAIQVLTAEQQPTPTLVFDEVDVGIGGAIAEVVGQLLRQLSRHCQVLCITHLPQVAVQAHQHHHIEKRKQQRSTTTTVKQLDANARQQEIARMLGGVALTEQTLAHAKEMLALVI